MKLQKLQSFIEIAKHQSYSKAAERLFVSQPALSKQIRLLEEELGFPLFIRHAQGILLTEKGQGLYTELEPMFSQIHRTIKRYEQDDVIRFGSTPIISTYYLHQHYSKLQHLSFHVTVIEEDSQHLVPHLKSGKIDAAIVQDISVVEGLHSEFLFTDRFLAAVPSQSTLALKSNLTVEECLSMTQILPSEGASLPHINRMLAKHPYTGKPLETHYQAMTGLVSLGAGIAYVPYMMASNIEFRGVTFLPIEGDPITRDMYLLASSRDLLDALKELFTS
ncbi:hypothetical protein N781_16490 [Pontibacillus halophilus JSM 076056 = DSM 19796]|uniref:HTH lysR-type domain-containing protein n=1 Tax=Pontibacillus halophilus JSM 076056 = DSM 19796 TaxID=1385510 RepID=A0A0A5GMY6_9BACI|nr:LysR family transcriptional regulator [Pontibacillus halophilus]KGX92490.1 hypothetical protein N781_16490 [Pontibacillus halophilus JSM 076056 = DSM 19796]